MLKLQNYFLSWGMILIGVFMNVLGAYVVKLKINELGGIQAVLAIVSKPLNKSQYLKNNH